MRRDTVAKMLVSGMSVVPLQPLFVYLRLTCQPENRGAEMPICGNQSQIFYRAALILCALMLLVLVWPSRLRAEVLAAWVELVGQNNSSIRVIVSAEDTCPAILVDGESRQMQVRAEPGPVFPAGDSPPSARFPVRVCEMSAPRGPSNILLQGKRLPL